MRISKANEEKKLWQSLKQYLFDLLKYLPFLGIYFFPDLKLARKVSLKEDQKDGEYQDFQATHVINLEKKFFGEEVKIYRQISYMQAETEFFFSKGKIREKNFLGELFDRETTNSDNIYCQEIKIKKKMKFFIFPYIECEVNTVFFLREGGEVKQVLNNKTLIVTWPWNKIARRTGNIFDGVSAEDTREIDIAKLKNWNRFQAKKINSYYELYEENQEQIEVNEDQKLGYVASLGEYLTMEDMLKKIREDRAIFNPFEKAEAEIEEKESKKNIKNAKIARISNIYKYLGISDISYPEIN